MASPAESFGENLTDASQLSKVYDTRFEHLYPAIDESIENGLAEEHPEIYPDITYAEVKKMTNILKKKSRETGHDFTSRAKAKYGLQKIKTIPIVNQRLRERINHNLKFMLHEEAYKDAVRMHAQISQFKRNKRLRYKSDDDEDEDKSSEYEKSSSDDSESDVEASDEDASEKDEISDASEKDDDVLEPEKDSDVLEPEKDGDVPESEKDEDVLDLNQIRVKIMNNIHQALHGAALKKRKRG
jgi:hypothetical protein